MAGGGTGLSLDPGLSSSETGCSASMIRGTGQLLGWGCSGAGPHARARLSG